MEYIELLKKSIGNGNGDGQTVYRLACDSSQKCD